ncbi:hypothetical protein I549_5591 [Mycobacterium avium subsp. avium 2285 (R)]|nr:hypothetical protein I549_5591 [Mycobacterium avium subsp. avium 2285 (R)]
MYPQAEVLPPGPNPPTPGGAVPPNANQLRPNAAPMPQPQPQPQPAPGPPPRRSRAPRRRWSTG